MRPVTALPLLLLTLSCFMGTPTEIDPDAEREVLTEIRLLSDDHPGFNALGLSLTVLATPLNQWGFPYTGGTVALEWTSSDTDVVVVAGDGRDALVTAVGNGDAFISARSGDIWEEFRVWVEQVPHQVTVTPSMAELFLDPPYHFTGSPVQLIATVTDREGEACEAQHCAVTWSSADSELAGVTAAGVVWPRASGSTEIHAVVRRPCFDVMTCWHLEDTVSVTVSPR
jgi:hypothetical protein